MKTKLQNPNCHFDCSPDLSGRSGEISLIDSSARLRLARNDNHIRTAKGFSLMEMLLAVGILAVGMLFVAGVFPVSIRFISVSSERTIAATVADEAFAKIELYGLPPGVSVTNQTTFEVLLPAVPYSEFAYPSIPTSDPNSKRYWWSALCRRVDPFDPFSVQVTVFVSRKVGAASKYLKPSGTADSDRPVAVPVGVTGTTGSYDLTISGNTALVNDGYTIVDDATGQIYRVLERYGANLNLLRLDKPWRPDLPPLQVITGVVWVVPPAGTVIANQFSPNGRYPCIAVYQKVMRF